MVAAVIARNHKEAGFDVSGQQGVTRTVLDELTQDDSPGVTRALPLDLDCYLAIWKVAKEQCIGRGGHEERAANARRRGALDVAMIGLMRDARLRVNEASALTWGDVERVQGGSGRMRVGDTDYRVVSADTMKLLSSVRRGRRRGASGHEAQPDSDTDRCGGQAGWIGQRLLGGQSAARHDQCHGAGGSAPAGRPPSRVSTTSRSRPTSRVRARPRNAGV